MKEYKTAGRESLLDFLSKNPDQHFTADELCQKIHGSDSKKSSVYRHLTELCNKDIIRKFQDQETMKTCYQYVGEHCDCRNHFHAKCLVCGALEHISCRDSVLFASHLLEEHGFWVDCGQSILYGVCANCRKQGEQHG